MNWLDDIKWDAEGMVPALHQAAHHGDLLVGAGVNRAGWRRGGPRGAGGGYDPAGLGEPPLAGNEHAPGAPDPT